MIGSRPEFWNRQFGSGPEDSFAFVARRKDSTREQVLASIAFGEIPAITGLHGVIVGNLVRFQSTGYKVPFPDRANNEFTGSLQAIGIHSLCDLSINLEIDPNGQVRVHPIPFLAIA